MLPSPTTVFNPQAPHDRRKEPVPASCLLTPTCTPPSTIMNKYSYLLRCRRPCSKRPQPRPTTVLGSNALTFGRRLSFSNYYLPGLSPRKSEIGVSMSAVMAALGSTQPPLSPFWLWGKARLSTSHQDCVGSSALHPKAAACRPQRRSSSVWGLRVLGRASIRTRPDQTE